MPSKPEKPEIAWRGGVPVSTVFDDLYYSSEGGAAESKFVFLDGARILENIADKDNFTIGETGFGTGLNFLTTWQAWRDTYPDRHLTFVSAEAFPMSVKDMEKAHKAFPDLKRLSKQLRSIWPPVTAGFHSHSFDGGNVSLLLMFGDAAEMFKQLHAKIDAWYLDGFAPAKNPDMWGDALFECMAELSENHASVATFTAAGFVRRGLQAHGFDVEKRPGFGRKRERLVGMFKRDNHTQPAHQNSAHRTAANPVSWAATPEAQTDKIVVVGDGIAGASVAYSLAQRGLNPILVAPKNDNMKASGLPAAILTPQLMLEDIIEKSFFYAAFSHAVNHPAYQHAFSEKYGAEYVPTSPEEAHKFQEILTQFRWGDGWMRPCNEGLMLSRGGTVDPEKILRDLTQNINRTEGNVKRLKRCSAGWRVLGINEDTIIETSTVVLATGVRTTEILAASDLCGASKDAHHPSIRPKGGQLEYVAASAVTGAGEHTKTFGGFISAAIATGKHGIIRVVGSTYDKMSDIPTAPIEPSHSARQLNLKLCQKLAGAKFSKTSDMKSWTGIRATTPDHMPYAGPIPNWNDLRAVCAPLAIDRTLPITRTPTMETGLYCLTGLGSKGFQYGPLLGDYIAAMICGDPSPIPRDLHAKLHPARGFVRAIIRGDASPG